MGFQQKYLTAFRDSTRLYKIGTSLYETDRLSRTILAKVVSAVVVVGKEGELVGPFQAGFTIDSCANSARVGRPVTGVAVLVWNRFTVICILRIHCIWLQRKNAYTMKLLSSVVHAHARIHNNF